MMVLTVRVERDGVWYVSQATREHGWLCGACRKPMGALEAAVRAGCPSCGATVAVDQDDSDDGPYQSLFMDAMLYGFGVAPARTPVEGDQESAVDPDAIKELVALAKADKREDFDFLAGAVGVPASRRDELWSGTRTRLNKPHQAPSEPPFYGRGLPELMGLPLHFMWWSVQQDPTQWTAPQGIVMDDFVTEEQANTPEQRQRVIDWYHTMQTLERMPPEPPALRNGLRRPPGYRERARWQDRRQGRTRPWE